MSLVFKYTLFAFIAIAGNVVIQDISIVLYSGIYSLYFSIGMGTIAGLLVKYILDKLYIFKYTTTSMFEDFRTFTFYSAMGGITTIIFWATELGFEFIFQSKQMRYLGAVLGLSIGYYIKYHLDKRFVFV